MLVLLLYISVLASFCLLIFILLRQKMSYFEDVKIYFAIAYVGIAVVILSGVLMQLFPSEVVAYYAAKVGVSVYGAVVAAMSLSMTILYERFKSGSKKRLQISKIMKSPFAVIHYMFLLIVLTLTWVLTPFQIKPITGLISGEMIYIPIFETWYVASLLVVVGFLLAYSSSFLLLLRQDTKPRKVTRALRGFGYSWAGVGVFTFAFYIILLSMGSDLVWIGHLISTVFLGITVYLFKETTILESLLEETFSPFDVAREGEIALVTYTSTSQKMRSLSAFVREGLQNGDAVFYAYPDKESQAIRTKLKQHGIDVEKYEREGKLYLRSLSEFFMADGSFNKEEAIQFLLNLRAEAEKGGYGIREIEDLGDFSFLKGEWQKYVDYWDDPMWGAPPGVGIFYKPFIRELTAVNIGSMSEVQVSEILKTFGGGRIAPTKLIDFMEWREAFSKSVGLSRQQMFGRKFLLEFNPVHAYEKVVEDFAKEARANLDPVFIFTSSSSSIRASLANYQTIKFFLMSISATTPESTSENEIVLPAKNTALILDSLDKILETHSGTNVCLVFESLSDTLLSGGFEKTYAFTKHALEMLASQLSTVLFLLNPEAHDPTTVSRFRNLFDNQLTYTKEGLQVVKLSSRPLA